MSYYQQNREERLEYQKNYVKKNKKKYKAYQKEYYNVIKEIPGFKEYTKLYRDKRYQRIKTEKDIQRCIKRTKQLMTKMLKELLKKVPLYEEVLQQEQEPKEELYTTPFAGIKLNNKGYFILEW